MKNEYIEKIINRIQSGDKVGYAQKELAWAYQKPACTINDMICLDNPISNDENAVAMAQQLSLAGINELYITGEWSNQFGSWFAMDAFGLKLRGIVLIDNAEYHQDIDRWGSSSKPERMPALKFSFHD